MPVIVIPAILAGIASLFSGVINIIMQLPTSIKLLVFYAVFLGMGISFPGTEISLASQFLSPLFLAVFGFFGIYADYNLLLGLFTVILLLYYAQFLAQGWGKK